MKVQVPGDGELDIAYKKITEDAFFLHEQHAWNNGVKYGVSLANEQLASPLPTKRPFLSDTEIEDGLIPGEPGDDEFIKGARWARDKYEAMMSVTSVFVPAKWQPVFGMKCAFWNTGEAYTRTDLWVGYSSDFVTGMKVHKGQNLNHGQYCAALETLDEIGKSPSYFIERGRCTVAK